MAARKQQINLLAFLQNQNVVVIHDRDEFEWFLHAMHHHGILELVPCGTLQTQTYDATVAGFRRDNRAASPGVRYPDWDGKTLYAECQIGKESIGIYPYSVRATVEWYGRDPLTVSDILDPGPGAVGGK